MLREGELRRSLLNETYKVVTGLLGFKADPLFVARGVPGQIAWPNMEKATHVVSVSG